MEPGVAYSPTPADKPITPNAHRKTPMGLVFVGLILLVVLGAVAYMKLTSKTAGVDKLAISGPTPTTPAHTPLTLISPTPAAKANSWKDYTDPNNNFSLSYPPQYSLKPYSESSFNGIELGYSQAATTASSSAQITMKVIYLNNSAKSAHDFANDQLKLEKASAINQTKFKGLDAFEIPLVASWGRGKIVFFQNSGTVYRISTIIAAPLDTIPGYQATIDQILSSFKILDYSQRGK